MSPTRQRIDSLDILRGLVIILMAVDHIRDFWALTPFQPEDLSQTTPGWFFTRWITHFCAPIFVFLAGTAVYLYARKVQDRATVSGFLLKRGLWLIVIEIILINMSFNWLPFFLSWGLFLQVIWVIGVSMIVLAGLIWLHPILIALISLTLIVGHNALNFVTPEMFGSFRWLWVFLHEGGYVPLGRPGFGLFVAYPLIPWIGVMGIGYVFGIVMTWERERRTRMLWALGLGCLIVFIALRFSNLYGDTGSWETQDSLMFTIMSFLNTQKYPPSLLFLTMTLGPGFLLLILFERFRSPVFDGLKVFGRVPLFFYVLHFIVIHVSSLLYFRLVHGEWLDVINTQGNWPEWYEPSLIRLYAVWAVIVVGFYFACRWYDGLKARSDWWGLRYL